jgi:hypothetical protein
VLFLFLLVVARGLLEVVRLIDVEELHEL